MSPSDEYFGPDDYQPPQTPPLRPAQPVYRHVDTPPPLVDPYSSSGSSESEKEGEASSGEGGRALGSKRRPRGRKGRPASFYAQALLIHQLDPNSPDIVRQHLENPLEAPSDTEDDLEAELMSVTDDRGHEANHVNRAAELASKALAAAVAVENEDFEMRDRPEDAHVKDEDIPARPVPNGVYKHEQEDASDAMIPEAKLSSKALDVKPPPRTSNTLAPIVTKMSDDEHSPAVSPSLAKFTITSAEGNPDSILPAMQMSPPRSSSGHSPGNTTVLPSLQTALSLDSSGSGSGSVSYSLSPTLTRPSPNHPNQYAPSPSSYSQPASGMSPPGIPTHPNYWRSTPREGSMSTPSDYQSTPSSLTAMTPTSTVSYTPSIATVSEHNKKHHFRQDSIDESTSATSPQSQGPEVAGSGQTNGSFSTNVFRCSYPGCTAVPFQTQYLLNSHANVHSSSRPHFCPVTGCPRGPGGKGFKRKNEMIRHGLVHDSPGYVCPFCPDQQHKYPRPDNLQRHVRVHHVDKDRDDPMLRSVLAQRPEGPNRGRRRRGGSTG